MQWHMKLCSINTEIRDNIYFTLPELIATKTATWNCHVDDPAKGKYDRILGRDLLIYLRLNLRLSDHVI